MTEQLSSALNGICPYFTMFPLDFPYAVLGKYASKGDWTLDPFCGRGTTNYASRLLGLRSYGVDSSPVAVAISQAKLANALPDEIVMAAKDILYSVRVPRAMPVGEFWNWAYEPAVLKTLCRLREGLLATAKLSSAEKALRGIILGALHGPRKKVGSSYFSNQSQRTYAPKPKYAVRYWKKNHLYPQHVDVLQIIRERAQKYYSTQQIGKGKIIKGDSRNRSTFYSIDSKIQWVITSPPYYGMRTYIPDQWLRAWFVGGPAEVDYTARKQLNHGGSEVFAMDLKHVWENVGTLCASDANLVIRFGGINDRSADPLQIIKESLNDTGWRITTIHSAGSANQGRRQAEHITKRLKEAREEYDIWAKWQS